MSDQTFARRWLTRLEHLETALQALVERRLQPLWAGGVPELGERLVQAMHEGVRQDEAQHYWAPNVFVISAAPPQAQMLRQDPALLDALGEVLLQASQEAEVEFSGPVVVRVVEDASLSADEVRVTAQHSPEQSPETTALWLAQEDSATPSQAKAYLVVNGTRLYAIQMPVINIGRRADNHLVVDDPRVSRVHAQLRWVRNRYMIFDLGSTGGTWVNGERIHQKELRDGDLISLAGVPLVFGQESSAGEDTAELPLKDGEA